MGKKKKSKEDKWIDEMKHQEKELFDKEHTFSEKEMKLAKRFMEKKHKVKEEAVDLKDEKIFDTSQAKEFNPEEAFKNAKTVELEDDGEDKVVFAPEPKEEKYVHFADDKDYVEKIEIDQHEFKEGAAGSETKPAKSKKKGSGKKLSKKKKGAK
jgi:hypothetical protein